MIVGLVGHAGSGRSRIGYLLNQRYMCSVMPLRDPVKSAAAPILNLLHHPSYGSKDDPVFGAEHTTPRKLYEAIEEQLFGHELGSDMLINLWRALYEQTFGSHDDNPHGVCSVVDDVRYRREAMAIKDMGGVLVRVYRPDADHQVDQANPPRTEAEVPMIECDHSIWNDGDLSDLDLRVNELADSLGMTKRPVDSGEYPSIAQGNHQYVYTTVSSGSSTQASAISMAQLYGKHQNSMAQQSAYQNILNNSVNTATSNGLTATPSWGLVQMEDTSLPSLASRLLAMTSKLSGKP